MLFYWYFYNLFYSILFVIIIFIIIPYFQAWQIPFIIALPERKSIYGETALLILLQRWNYPCKLVRLMHIFGIHYSTISLAITALVNHLVVAFTPLLTDNLPFFVTRFPLYRQSILSAHAANGNEVPFGLEDVVAFVDATIS